MLRRVRVGWMLGCLALCFWGCGDGGTAGSRICSPDQPDGACPPGQICIRGQCVTEEEPCGPDHPAGACPAGEVCLEGACVAEGDLCSTLAPEGLCPSGRTCLDGVCRDDDLLCSEDRPDGLCDAGQVCLDGVCVQESALCGAVVPDGLCPAGATCVDGRCVDDALLCGPDNPDGMCAGDMVCLDGACTDPDHACSPQHPDGTCEAGQTCLDGACVEDDLLCGPDNPEGLCLEGEVCTDGSCQPVSCDECPAAGATRCAGDDVQTCETQDDGCLRWSEPVSCGVGKVCAGDGECVDQEAAPVARLDCPLSGLVDEALRFDASASSDDGGIVSYRFTFGDGESLEGADAIVEHAYQAAATYTVGLTVEDADGLTDAVECVVVVEDDTPVNTPPVAAFTVVRLGGLEVQADATASHDAESAELEVRWDFDDDGTWESGWSTDRVAGHTYPADDRYTVRLEVRDPQGLSDSATRSVTVAAGDSPVYAPGTIQQDTTWSGTIIMANDVRVQQQATLTITAGTQVLVTGDYTLECEGPLVVAGLAGSPVLFTTYYAADSQPASWQGIVCREASTDIDHLEVEYGTACLTLWASGIRVDDSEARFCETGIQVWSGADLTRVGTHDNTGDGMAIAGYTANVRNCQSRRNGASGIHFNDWSSNAVHNVFQTACTDNTLHGIFKEGPGILNVTEADLLGNGADGAYFASSNQGYPEIVVRNSTFSGNGESGIRVAGAYSQYSRVILDAVSCDITGNRDGVVANQARLLLQKNQISANLRYGLKLDTRVLGSAVHQNNIHGNSSEAGFEMVDPQVGLSTGEAFVGTESTSWSTPAGEWIAYLRYHIVGGGDSYYFRIGSTPGGTDITNGWVGGGDYDSELFVPDTKTCDTLYIELDDESETSGLSFTLDEAGYLSDTAVTELFCVYEGPIDEPLDLAGNYWGTPDPSEVSFTAGQGPVDQSAALANPVPDAGRP